MQQPRRIRPLPTRIRLGPLEVLEELTVAAPRAIFDSPNGKRLPVRLQFAPDGYTLHERVWAEVMLAISRSVTEHLGIVMAGAAPRPFVVWPVASGFSLAELVSVANARRLPLSRAAPLILRVGGKLLSSESLRWTRRTGLTIADSVRLTAKGDTLFIPFRLPGYHGRLFPNDRVWLLSPEAVRGNPTTPASLSYVIGLLAYLLVTGRHAATEDGQRPISFAGSTMETLTAVAGGKRLPFVAPDYDFGDDPTERALAELFWAAVQEDAAARPAPRAMVAALAEYCGEVDYGTLGNLVGALTPPHLSDDKAFWHAAFAPGADPREAPFTSLEPFGDVQDGLQILNDVPLT